MTDGVDERAEYDREDGRGDNREFNHDPVICENCDEYVVVTRKEDARFDSDDPKFECGCSVGSMAASKPSDWKRGEFL